MKDPAPHIYAALESISAIQSYCPSTEAEFVADLKTRDAVLMRLQDIGENLSRVRESFPAFWAAHLSHGWNEIIGVRNIVAHGYSRVDVEAIWVIVRDDLDGLAESLAASLR